MTRAGRLGLLALMALLLCACSQSKSAAYNRAVGLFADGSYYEAAQAFERLGDYERAQTYAAYANGLVFYERGEYDAAEPCFATVRDFMYGESRYRFCHAYVLETQGAFAEACALFSDLTDEPYAALHAAYCRARDAEQRKRYEAALYDYALVAGWTDEAVRLANPHICQDASIRLDSLQTQIYDRALTLREEGDFARALELFGALGDYFDSREQARACKDRFREQLYNEAEALYAAGDLQAAYDAFSGLSGYSDAESRAEMLAKRLGIER